MASSASDLIKFEKQTTGENSGTWGTKANTAMSRLEESVHDITNIAVTGADYTLDDTQYTEHVDGSNTSESHVKVVKATGTLTGNRKIVVPLRNHTYYIWNGTGGDYTLSVGGSSGDTVTVPQGFITAVICDGTNCEILGLPSSVAGQTILLADLDMSTFGLDDANGNELVKFTTVGSAVNELTISNNATGSSPILSATGGDSNVSIVLTPKGTGSVNLGDTELQRPVLRDYGETSTTANSGSAYTIDLETGPVWDITLTANATFTFSNPPATGTAGSFTLILTQDGTGSRTATWPSSVDWSSGAAPTLTTTATTGVDILTFLTIDAGTTWFGFVAGQAMA